VALGVSLGKANYCLRALIRKGLIKARNFKNSRNKAAYAYLLTPQGIEEKVNVTYAFRDRGDRTSPSPRSQRLQLPIKEVEARVGRLYRKP
jgi:EPS-associated MarR family transcriptional regulator